MNVSPHQQRPTKYPWPGMASRLLLVAAVVLVVVIGFVVIFDPFRSSTDDPEPTVAPTAAARSLG